VVEAAPWTLAKGACDRGCRGRGATATALYTLIETLRLAAVFCEPFIPAAAARIATQLGLTADERSRSHRWGGTAPGTRVQPGPTLFPKK